MTPPCLDFLGRQKGRRFRVAFRWGSQDIRRAAFGVFLRGCKARFKDENDFVDLFSEDRRGVERASRIRGSGRGDGRDD